MFEELITQLDDMGVTYTEDYEAGVITVDIADIDKAQLIEVINVLNGYDMPFTIDDTSITVSGMELPEEEMVEEPVDETDYTDEALNSLGMF